MANDIIFEDKEANEDNSSYALQSVREQKLVQWIVDRVQRWEDYRDSNFKSKWDEYYRLWRGIWTSEDKSRQSERSKLIVPALQQAIESAVAELEEATFGKGVWFDIEDDLLDQQKEDALIIRDLLKEDMEVTGVPQEIAKVYLNGALYGTGIGKILVDTVTERTIGRVEHETPLGVIQEPSSTEQQRVVIKLEAIDPREFAIDPSARNVQEALGVAHTPIKPKHSVVQKQRQGIYKDIPLGSFEDTADLAALGLVGDKISDDKVRIIEYHGLVPESLLNEEEEDEEEAILNPEQQELSFTLDVEDDELVEAIVTIANDRILLRAVRNPYLMGDRSIVAYQHDTVPNQFWGRGVAEKGFNPQKALDAELRARIDGLALTTHPMMAADATRIGRNPDMTVRPGRTIFTNGSPREVLLPFNFGTISPSTFHQSGELERMIQMGTGSMDSATPVTQNPRNQTASGMSMIQSAAIKRTKRSMQNIERTFLIPLINKTAWRYIQFDPERYPIRDYKFLPKSAMGIMAREIEQGQMTQLLSVVPPDSPVFNVLIQGIFENSSLSNKSELMEALEQAKQPNPMEQQAQQIAMQKEVMELEKLKSEIEEIKSEVAKNLAEIEYKKAQIGVEVGKLENDRWKEIMDIAAARENHKQSNGN